MFPPGSRNSLFLLTMSNICNIQQLSHAVYYIVQGREKSKIRFSSLAAGDNSTRSCTRIAHGKCRKHVQGLEGETNVSGASPEQSIGGSN